MNLKETMISISYIQCHLRVRFFIMKSLFWIAVCCYVKYFENKDFQVTDIDKFKSESHLTEKLKQLFFSYCINYNIVSITI